VRRVGSNPARSRLQAAWTLSFTGRARPPKILGFSHQPRLHGVPLDVRSDAVEFAVPDQMIVALILPKRLTGGSQTSIGFMGGETFERSPPSGGNHVGGNQQMDVIRHHDVGVQLVTTPIGLSLPQGGHHQSCDFRPTQGKGTGGGGIQEPVHGGEGSSIGSHATWRKYAMVGKTATEPEGDKERLADHMIVG
jgi:hypothetical protein